MIHWYVFSGFIHWFVINHPFSQFQLFSKNYADMMKDFITDDHDHPFSITSLSVQIFTVPTIAHYLIETHDVIFTIMRTLMSECEQKLNSGILLTEILADRFFSYRGDLLQGLLNIYIFYTICCI